VSSERAYSRADFGSDKLKDVTPRKSVMRHARAMEKVLQLHDSYKGNQMGRDGVVGWRQTTALDLIDHLFEEVHELLREYVSNGGPLAENLAYHVIDVSNISMMLFDSIMRDSDLDEVTGEPPEEDVLGDDSLYGLVFTVCHQDDASSALPVSISGKDRGMLRYHSGESQELGENQELATALFLTAEEANQCLVKSIAFHKNQARKGWPGACPVMSHEDTIPGRFRIGHAIMPRDSIARAKKSD